MALAHSAVAFDYTVTTTFSKGLALWGAVVTVSGKGLTLWSAVGTVSGKGLALWSAVGTVSGKGLALWSAVGTVSGKGLALWSAVGTVSGKGLALWSAVGSRQSARVWPCGVRSEPSAATVWLNTAWVDFTCGVAWSAAGRAKAVLASIERVRLSSNWRFMIGCSVGGR